MAICWNRTRTFKNGVLCYLYVRYELLLYIYIIEVRYDWCRCIEWAHYSIEEISYESIIELMKRFMKYFLFCFFVCLFGCIVNAQPLWSNEHRWERFGCCCSVFLLHVRHSVQPNNFNAESCVAHECQSNDEGRDIFHSILVNSKWFKSVSQHNGTLKQFISN